MTEFQPNGTPDKATVAISTMGPRMSGITLPAQHSGLQYLVIVQDPPAEPLVTDRDDVTYLSLSVRGLSASRNAALVNCATPYVLFSDDDVEIYPKAVMQLAHRLDASRSLDLISGWRSGDMIRPKRHRLTVLNSGHICAPKFMVRKSAVIESKITFDTAFGVGAAYPISEDYIFVCDMLRAGLQGQCVPIVVGKHSGPSTGSNWTDPEVLRARNAMLHRVFGRAAPIFKVAYAFKHRTQLGGIRSALSFAFSR